MIRNVSDFRPTPEMIERLRQTGIRLDREGRFWHEGAVVTHRGFQLALLRWLDRLDEKRYAYVDVDDAELLALSARWDGDRAILALNDETEEELDYASLAASPDNALYCRARNGRLTARITTPAYYILAERIEETPDGRFCLRAAGKLHPIGSRST